MVRGWAHKLRNRQVSGFAAIAQAEGISVPRVSQLMVLERLSPEEVESIMTRLKRVSVRAVIQTARTGYR